MLECRDTDTQRNLLFIFMAHKRILVIRNDKLGDFMLSYPAFALLKQNLPEHEICALVPQYTADMADACQWIDTVVIDPGANAGYAEQLKLLKSLRMLNCKAAITLFSTGRIGLLLWLSRIAYRLAPATKLAQIFYNQRLTQRRSQSAKPESEYNLDLARYYLKAVGIEQPFECQPPYLRFADNEMTEIRVAFTHKHGLNSTDKWIFVHVGSGGSANNLNADQYQNLTEQLASLPGYYIVLSAGPADIEQVRNFSQGLGKLPHAIYLSDSGLLAFARHINLCDMFISGSTGPLHIAAALNKKTVAFYPRRRSATALRWQTINSETNRLAFSPPAHADESDMSSIDIAQVVEAIKQKFL